jgi:hypothetical protein
MEQYRFNHEELFVLLDPAIQLLKQAESTALCPGKFAFEGVKNLVNDNGYSMACGDFSSAYNWYAERTPVKDVELYHHPGLGAVVQIKLLGVAWKILRAVLWQQVQPKTDRYLDRFLMVAHYVYDNPDLMVKIAEQYPGVWTNLVDHLEPRDVDYQWTRYAALRDVGLAYRTPRATPEAKPTSPLRYKTKSLGTATHDSVCPICNAEADNPLEVGFSTTPKDNAVFSLHHNVQTAAAAVRKKWSDKAAKAIEDGTHPLYPTCEQASKHQYTFADGTVSVFSCDLSSFEEQLLEKRYGPFVKIPYTGSIKVGANTKVTVSAKTGKTTTYVHAGPLPEGTVAESGKALGRELMVKTEPRTLTDHVKEAVNHSGLAPTMEIGSGQPGIQWARVAAEVTEIYQALKVSPEAADAVWKRIMGEK